MPWIISIKASVLRHFVRLWYLWSLWKNPSACVTSGVSRSWQSVVEKTLSVCHLQSISSGHTDEHNCDRRDSFRKSLSMFPTFVNVGNETKPALPCRVPCSKRTRDGRACLVGLERNKAFRMLEGEAWLCINCIHFCRELSPRRAVLACSQAGRDIWGQFNEFLYFWIKQECVHSANGWTNSSPW